MIDITGTDPLFLGELGERVNSEKLQKLGIFNLKRSDRILIKFDVWKDTMSQSSYFKSRLDLVKEKLVGQNLKSWKMLRVEGSG